MKLFSRMSRLYELYKQKKIQIISSMPEDDFAFVPERQIEGDSINLRLHPIAQKVKPTIEKIDLLEDNTKQYLETVVLPHDGYCLKPGDILFCHTLEKIRITSRQHLGLIIGRPTVATYGISVTLDQSKVPIDLPWNFPLHLRNNTTHDIIIYPFVNIVQLILLEYAFGNISPYDKGGKFNKIQYNDRFPGIIGDERQDLQNILVSWEQINKNSYNFEANDIKQENEIKKGDRRYKFPLIRVTDILYPIILALAPVLFTELIQGKNDHLWWAHIGYVVALLIITIFKLLS